MRSARILLAATLLLGTQACTAEEHVAIAARPPALQQRIDAALAAKGAAYRPRTEHLLANGQPRYTNRLILEDSPYLLQHAHNPVDWYPWGKEAFAKAQRENKLIFLSIGYSTCHWCHVMEKESFENLAIARLLNRHFVAIKVDRESRPDLDHLYMTAVNLLAGQGGWPMTSLLTPDGNTVHGGTYYRPADLTLLLTKVDQLWREHPAELKTQSASIARAVNKTMALEAAVAELPPALAATTTHQLLEHHDALQGGFGTAPKFPNEPLLALLLDQAVRANDLAARTALTTDLDAMAAGGIHDQAGGGFYRYSTDSEWLVPHFEKMLYTQAQLARLYLAAGHGKGEYARVTRRVLDFVLREMTAPDGGFYSALDADSAGGEGRHDLWTPDAVRAALGADDAAFAIRHYGITPSGNFEGSTILHLSRPLGGEARARLDRIDAALLKARQQRPRPPRDDKVLTGWNGLMITILAEAGDRLDEPRYLAAARRAAETLWQHHRRTDGGLWRVSLNGRASTAGMLEDYAYLAEALIALYDATGETVWLARAQQLADAMQSRFDDKNGGGYFLAESDPYTPMARPRDTTDGALPSANGVALHVLAALARRSGEMRFEKQAQTQLAALSGAIQRDPAGHATLLAAMERLRSGETGARQYAGRGAVMAMAHAVPQGTHGARIELTLRIKSGWHVNAHQPLQDYLIPTTLKPAGTDWRIVRVEYPEATVGKLGFQKEALALYQGDVTIRAELQGKAGGAMSGIPLELRLQTCSDRICLPPEMLRLDAWAR